MTKRIRVLYTIPNFNTAGSGKSVYDLVKNLDRNSFEPEICCFHDEGPFFKKVQALGVKIHIFPFTTAYRPWSSFLFRVWRIRNFYKRGNFDIIHSWHWSSDISEPLAAKLAGIHYIYTKKAMGWGNRYWKFRSLLSSRVIAVNTDMMSEYFKNMPNKVKNFPLAIDVDNYKPQEADSSLKEKLNIQEGDFLIISVANLVPVKGIETLCNAVLKLSDPRLKVLIVGNDTNDYGIELKKEFGSNPAIMFLGKQMDVKPYLALANVFIIPTKNEGRKEGIPNAPLEAMAMERVVLGSNISGINDILKNFPDCLFTADSVNELSEKIQFVQKLSGQERENLAKEMRKEVISKYSITEFLNNHQELYLELVR